MYGTRDAASLRENTYRAQLEKIGFVSGKASPCCFWHPTLQVSVVVHGDDFTALGVKDSLDQYERLLSEAFELKIRGRLGEEEGCDKEIRILNRVVKITESGLEYEADPRHAELLVDSLGLQGKAPALTTGVKENPREDQVQVAEEPEEIQEEPQSQELANKINVLKMTNVRFNLDIDFYKVPACLELYGYSSKQAGTL